MNPLACTINTFRAALAPRFVQAPAQHSLLAGWVCKDGIPLFQSGSGLAALEPSINTLVTDEWPADQDEALLAALVACSGKLPRKIIAVPAEARRIAQMASRQCGLYARVSMRSGCYRLAQLKPLMRAGTLRAARIDEVPLLQDWDAAMALDAKLGPAEAHAMRELTRLGVERGRRRIWDDAGARCTLGFVPIGSAYRILLVYTPAEYRGRHYASAAVAALCDELLVAASVISLYADLDNPVSNRVYRGIGFVLEGELLNIELE